VVQGACNEVVWNLESNAAFDVYMLQVLSGALQMKSFTKRKSARNKEPTTMTMNKEQKYNKFVNNANSHLIHTTIKGKRQP
jgi:hypothetical protein